MLTLEQLWKVIHTSYTPSPLTMYRENIFDIKSWLPPYTATLKDESNPHVLRRQLTLKFRKKVDHPSNFKRYLQRKFIILFF